MPSKVAADDDFFSSLPGVLAAFFEFLADRNNLTQGEELAQAVQSVREEITTAAAYNQEQMDQLEADFKQEPKRNYPDWDVGRNER